MTTSIGNVNYEKIVKDKTIYFIRSDVHQTHDLTDTSEEDELMLMSDFAFDVIKSRYGVEELIKRHC